MNWYVSVEALTFGEMEVIEIATKSETSKFFLRHPEDDVDEKFNVVL